MQRERLPKHPKHELNHTDCLTVGYVLQLGRRVSIFLFQVVSLGTAWLLVNFGAYIASVTPYNKAIIIFISPRNTNLTWVKPGYRHGSYSTLNCKSLLPDIVVFSVNVTSGAKCTRGRRRQNMHWGKVRHVFGIHRTVQRDIFLQ